MYIILTRAVTCK